MNKRHNHTFFASAGADGAAATRFVAVGNAGDAVEVARRFPGVSVRVYADGWRAVDDARALIETHRLDDRVTVHHRDACRTIGPRGCGARAA